MDWVAIITAAGTVIVTALGVIVKGLTDAKLVALQAQVDEAHRDITDLKDERDSLRKTLEQQAATLAEQSGRLTTTINALTQVTLERDVLKIQVQALTTERDALAREVENLRAQAKELASHRLTEGERGE